MNKIKLNNGVLIPQIGYGTYQIPKEITKECVLNALKIGYRHIDTAFAYDNEKEVGEAIRESQLNRKDVFVTTKVYGAKDYQDACDKIERSLKALNIGYIDLMLIHWPEGDNIALYKAMEYYYHQGKIKAIGVSNFYGEELNKILTNTEVTPVLDQIEAHVFYNQKEMQSLLKDRNIVLEAWSPLAAAKFDIFDNPVLLEIANKYQKTTAQVALRYLYQREIIILPRSKNVERMKENIDILDFELDQDDINKIETLNENRTVFNV